MKKILIYDPAMCCASGVCGPEVDPLLPRFAGMLAQLEGQGVEVERYNLAQQPIAFAQNTDVRAVLEKEGPEALPLIYIDGELVMQGRYPEMEERGAWVKQARQATAEISSE
ncbi:MAG: arsenical resistance operon transcriptional repressor ArsD [Puniceicoccaceae bacterium]|nr:MAG: arsenical resistance operon transcriptional repressor ArsD [Puniceicoccaceae bacterium]